MRNKILLFVGWLASAASLVSAQSPGALPAGTAGKAPAVAAEEPAVAADASVASCNADIGVMLSPDASVEKAFQEFARQRGIKYGVPDASGFVYYSVSAGVNAGPDDPAFVTSRMSAFARAYGDGIARHIQCMKDGLYADAKAADGRAGVCVVKTAESCDATNGMYRIGVILKYDPFLARAIRSAGKARPAVGSGRGLPASALLAGDNPRMTQNFGTRFYYDEKRRPALLAFGQWPVTTGEKDPRQLIQIKNDAQQKAGNLAIAFLDGFLAEHALTVDGKELARGAQLLFRGVLKHPSGVDVAVVVFGWDFPESVGKSAQSFFQEQPVYRLGDEYDF